MAAARDLALSDFVHLHNHTQYSLLDGLTKVPALMDFVKKSGMEAVAQTDHGTLSGAIEFYKTAQAQGVKPIIGMEGYVAARTIADKDPGKDKQYYHLILLAMNNQGYQNLMRLSTIANLDGFYYKPRIDHILLEKYNEGLIVLSGCIGGEVADAIRQGQYDQAVEIASWYKRIFGDRYYIEVQDHGHPEHPSKWDEQVRTNEQLLKLADELDIPPVITADAHYLQHEDQTAHEILLCVQTGSFMSDEKRMSLANFELHVTDPKELIKRWGKVRPDAIKNTKRIADRCHIDIELGKILIPKFPVPKGETEKSYLNKLVWQGLAWRYGGVPVEKRDTTAVDKARKLLSTEIIERAEYELKVMDQMGYNGYFLIVQDFINWGKNQGVIFGPGRGSAAGSIVSYAIRITEIDPMKYDLMFERFLNPHRISMPDIDIDIQDTRRDEVIQYCVQKYGDDRVANIVTFGRMAARNAVRDVARVLQIPYAEADRWAKMIPPPVQGRHIPLETSLKDTADLKREYATNETAKQVFDLAMQLEGTIRSHGVHAAGVVIAPDDIVKFTPLEMAQKGVIATQYPMGPIEELGLLKMDFLGLSNLTILKNALRIIRKVYKKEIELGEIPNDDDKTFALFRAGDSTGVFQFESAGMKRYMKELKPTEFSDLVAMNALYRPGPMQEIPRFIEGKNHPASVQYLHKSLEPILQETYGVMVYQEQIIQLLQLVAGYSAGEADLVRKAIGKKKRDIMQAEEPKFIKGCVKQGLTEAQAKHLWAQIQPFADYSFNKAHATCYAQIAYWTAYLKAHYPSAFMAALMTSDYDDTDRLAIEITECQHMGINVLPPDVSESFHEFAVVANGDDRKADIIMPGKARKEAHNQSEYRVSLKLEISGNTKETHIWSSRQEDHDNVVSFDESKIVMSHISGGRDLTTRELKDNIRFGLDAIKNVGSGAVEEILRARAIDNGFSNLEDFLSKVSTRVVNRKTMESLVRAGALERFSDDRSMLLHNLDVMLAYGNRLQKEANSGQVDLFGALLDDSMDHKPKLTLEKAVTIFTPRDQLLWERELLGLYLSQHPLSMYEGFLTEQTHPIGELKPEHDNKAVIIGGAILDMREITTRNGQKMAFVKVEDQFGSLELILFPGVYQQTVGLWERDRVVLVRGKISAKDKEGNIGTEIKVLVDDAREITAEQATAYTSTGKKLKLPGARKNALAIKPASAAAKTATTNPRIYVRMADSQNQEQLLALKQIIDERNGPTEVVLVLGPDNSKQIIKLPGGILYDDAALEKLRTLVGEDNLKVS